MATGDADHSLTKGAADRTMAQLTALRAAERSVYSQNGEDGVLEELTARTRCPLSFVEIGAGEGTECNSRWWRERGWATFAFDGDPAGSDWVRTAFVTAENAVELAVGVGAPGDPGVLSIDLDGNDFWVARALLGRLSPSILVVEYNAMIGPSEALTVVYRRRRLWDHTNYFGASLRAFAILAASFDYALVYCESKGVNAFFVRRSLLESSGLVEVPVGDAYVPPRFGLVDQLGTSTGHEPTTRRFARVGTAAEIDAWAAAIEHHFPLRALAAARVRARASDGWRLWRRWIKNRYALARHGVTAK